jgi:flagellar biosynthesis anti-sigma factor FlgM
MAVQAMKIFRPDSNSTSGLNPLAGAGSSRMGSASKQPLGREAASDQVQLSSLSSHLASALDGSPALAAKVSELHAAVSNGQYHVDAYAVSGSIIQHRIEFGGTSYLALSR